MTERTDDPANAWTPVALGLFVAAGIVVWLTVFVGWLSQSVESDETRLLSHFEQCPLPTWIDNTFFVGVAGAIVGSVVLVWGVVRVAMVTGAQGRRTIEGIALILFGAVFACWGLLTAKLMYDTAEVCVGY